MNVELVLRCPACGRDALADDEYCESCGMALGLLRDTRSDHVELTTEHAAGVSDRGLVHRRNEDALFLETIGATTVVVVCDGVSTSAAPQVAARVAADSAGSLLSAALSRSDDDRPVEDVLREALNAAHAAVLDVPWMPSGTVDGPSCTIVAGVWDGSTITVAWSGDSRAYWISATGSFQLTSDHSWAQAQVDAGIVGCEQALADPRAHAITRWLGPDAPAEPSPIVSFRPPDGGWLVVCSDGLWNHLATVEQMSALVIDDVGGRPDVVARRLTQHAIHGGGHDNITVVVVAIERPAAAENEEEDA